MVPFEEWQERQEGDVGVGSIVDEVVDLDLDATLVMESEDLTKLMSESKSTESKSTESDSKNSKLESST